MQEGSTASPPEDAQASRSAAAEQRGPAAIKDHAHTVDSSPSSSRSASESGSRQASAAPSHHSGSVPTVETPSSSTGLGGFRNARAIPEDAFVTTATPWSRKSG